MPLHSYACDNTADGSRFVDETLGFEAINPSLLNRRGEVEYNICFKISRKSWRNVSLVLHVWCIQQVEIFNYIVCVNHIEWKDQTKHSFHIFHSGNEIHNGTPFLSDLTCRAQPSNAGQDVVSSAKPLRTQLNKNHVHTGTPYSRGELGLRNKTCAVIAE